MKLIVIENKKARLNKFIDWLFYMIGYAIILITVSIIFKHTIIIDSSFFGFWGFIAAVIIYFLNKTVKPILVFLTLPLTGITFGLFYPFVNVIILNIVDFILGAHFSIEGLFMSFIVAVLISIMNILLQEVVIKSILGGVK
ncbi:MAG: phage holin family protein [Tenericutes bacterium]|nr:phage holin family protein [Mycoplasmatota bacterium]